MRNFYIFMINDEFRQLLENSAYNLFKTLEDIYNIDRSQINLALNMYEQIVHPLNKNKINNLICQNNLESELYTRFRNTHMLNNFYNNEKSKLIVYSSYMFLQTSINTPKFFSDLQNFNNLFVCDFENQDYFWIKEFSVVKTK